MELNKITEKIIGCSIEVHKELGPDLLESVYESQILSYMKLGNFKVGLLINFNSKLLKQGIKRFIL